MFLLNNIVWLFLVDVTLRYFVKSCWYLKNLADYCLKIRVYSWLIQLPIYVRIKTWRFQHFTSQSSKICTYLRQTFQVLCLIDEINWLINFNQIFDRGKFDFSNQNSTRSEFPEFLTWHRLNAHEGGGYAN